MQATIMIANPIIIIIQVEVSGIGDAPRGGGEAIGGSAIGPGSPTEISVVGGISSVGGSVGAGGKSVSAGGESVDAGEESVNAGGKSVDTVCVVAQDPKVSLHCSERAVRSIVFCGTILLTATGVVGGSWVPWGEVDVVVIVDVVSVLPCGLII